MTLAYGSAVTSKGAVATDILKTSANKIEKTADGFSNLLHHNVPRPSRRERLNKVVKPRGHQEFPHVARHLAGALRSSSREHGQAVTIWRVYLGPQPLTKEMRTALGSKAPLGSICGHRR